MPRRYIKEPQPGRRSPREPYEEVKEVLPSQPVLNIDETGHKENGHRLWTWALRCPRTSPSSPLRS
ncbi:MAG: hypothetical protein LBV23_04125, partial [Deltaproteobacteria bacterium]|nr:hypothetical protein [Deltaproteobacteria bacterium]